MKKHAIITGGSEGIGLAAAEGFLERNIPVTLLARNQGKLDEAKEGLEEKFPNSEVYVASTDVTIKGQVESVIDNLVPSVDELYFFNNAGAFRLYKEETFHKDLDFVMSLNFSAPDRLAKYLLKKFEDTNKELHLITNLSHIVFRELPGNEIYKSTKLALKDATHNFEDVYADKSNIHFHNLYPGPIATKQIIDKLNNDPSFVPSDPVASTESLNELIMDQLTSELPSNDVYIGNFQSGVDELGLSVDDIKGISRIYLGKDMKPIHIDRRDPDFDAQNYLENKK